VKLLITNQIEFYNFCERPTATLRFGPKRPVILSQDDQAGMIGGVRKRRALLALALLLALVKSIQLAMDSQALILPDSGAFILNALRLDFISFRSYLYGDLIRAFAIPFHSLRAIVAMQVAMGGLTAWLLAFALVRFFFVRLWIAILAAIVFACDPVQVLYEHMVMAETASMLAMAAYLVTALQYIRTLALRWLVLLSLLGIGLAGLRTVYLPVVLAAAVLVPVVACIWAPAARLRLLAMALIVSCASTALFHVGYRHLTGWRAQREPAYQYFTGRFLLAAVSPIVEPRDSPDVHIAGAVAAQSRSRYPLLADLREEQLWNPEGLVARLGTVFGGNARETDQAAQSLARAAIRRNPLGYVDLGIHTWWSYWTGIPNLRWSLPWEIGTQPPHVVTAHETEVIRSAFGVDVSNQGTWLTLSRRYLMLGRNWFVFLLISPFLTGAAWWLSPANPKGMALLFFWSVLLLAAICFGAVDNPYRYLHPYSFTALASAAVLVGQAVSPVGSI
jgi:hypothetical protein